MTSPTYPPPVMVQGVGDKMGLIVSEPITYKTKNGMPSWLITIIFMLEHHMCIKPFITKVPIECRKSILEYANYSTKQKITSERVRQWRAIEFKRRKDHRDRLEQLALKKSKKLKLDTLQQEQTRQVPVVEITKQTENVPQPITRTLFRAAAPIKILSDLTVEQHREIAEKEEQLVGTTSRKRGVSGKYSTVILASRLAYSEDGKEYLEFLTIENIWKTGNELTNKEKTECREMFGRTLPDPGYLPEEVLGRQSKRVRIEYLEAIR